ncbi:MAG: response regulator transcription factor [PVC group bacterium]|nr:response regulator transcription factor [PVC group bacterium]
MMAKGTILLIDDEEDFCFFVKRNLERTGRFSVIYATDPDQGINLAKRNSPEIILLDITMPKKDGLQVLAQLKKDKKTMAIPIMMLTAVEDDQSKLTAARCYCEDYIIKPVTFEALQDKIHEVLSRQGK